jgi:two-component system sensor histidine kinase KdpD
MRTLIRALLSLVIVVAVTAIALRLGANAATVGFAFFIAILGIAIWTNLATALVSSIVATACYNFFFLPPLRTWAIHDPANWVALGSFFITSLVATRLVVRARMQAAEAEARRNEIAELAAERERFLVESAHLQALKEGDALKTSLLRAVSHDLATPLTAISLQIERLRTLIDDPAVDAISEETARLRRRIENLLAMARLEARSVVPRPEPTPAADLFRAAREHLPLIVESRPIEVHVASDCPEVFIDPSLALEILVNLIENAHQASPAGAPIELSAVRLSSDHVRLEVADRGRGIAAEASDTAHRGLGLEIARSLSTASGGEVTLANRAGGGAVARVDLPAAQLPAVEEVPA